MIRRKYIWRALQIIVTLSLLFLVFRNFNWINFGQMLSRLPFWFYPASLILLFIGQLLYVVRWRLVMRAIDIEAPFGHLIKQYFIGIFFSSLLPSAIGGDAAKAYYMGKKAGYINVAASVFMDRFLGFFSLTTLSMVMLWWLHLSSPAFFIARNVLTVFFFLFIGVFLLVIVIPPRWIGEKLRRLIPRFSRWVERGERFLTQIRLVGHKPQLLFFAMILVFIYNLLLCFIYREFIGLTTKVYLDIIPLQCLIMSMAILTNLPITINGIGLREQLHSMLLFSLGVSKEAAVGISLLIFSQMLVLSLVGAFFWMQMKILSEKRFETINAFGEK